MELRVSSPSTAAISSSKRASDHDEKEISDDDDDDRNHKHRRREMQSQSLVRGEPEHVLSRPFRKKNYTQPTENWRRRPTGSTTHAQNPFRTTNHAFSTELGTGRGRNRDSSSWNTRDPRFNKIDLASQMIPQGMIPPGLSSGRGLGNPSWNAFGLVPGMPNPGLDGLHHPFGILRPPLNPSLNMAIPVQRCRDFEEQGFCLRGDMCPMEHGINRIVIEDVQSLSQFNLPVSHSHLLGTSSGLPSSIASSSTMNSKGLHNKTTKPGIGNDGLILNDASIAPLSGGGADFYDPDQPLWTNAGPGVSPSLLGVNPSRLAPTDSDQEHNRSKSIAIGPKSTSSSLQGRIGWKSGLDMRERIDSSLNNIDEQNKQFQVGFRQKQTIDASLRQSSQKALYTLCVNGIPQKDNKRETLLSHFRKFGDVVHIHIPMNGEQAFVRFSKKEEAEAAFRAPDAVMGNRFIKLQWAKRDNFIADGITNYTPSVLARGSTNIPDREKDNLQPINPKAASSVNVPPTTTPTKFVKNNGIKGTPPSQKKTESLEILKEEIRKKHELLEQKRNEFKLQLDKMQKQGLKGEGQASKKQKVISVADVAKSVASNTADPGTVNVAETETSLDKNKSLENGAESARPSPPSSSKQSIGPLYPAGAPSPSINRFKLDNRPTAFKIVPPLPTGLANVAVLTEHFLPYGEVIGVEIEGGADNNSSSFALVSFANRRSAETAFLNGKSWQGNNLEFVWVTTTTKAAAQSSSTSSSLSAKENSPQGEENKVAAENDEPTTEIGDE
ncbi:zinc finger CCCH domain-containing protein 41 [Impatiens glandulifera]|uniref:zinc finger CCCH domain-containing protein 41 n=1 Tax=Impatiens glandulifera TaxID=253017 RepID=UPI001FB12087|nr:zinc finger CCCH domain-containing protein 41 [Impatiens glandulifera]